MFQAPHLHFIAIWPWTSHFLYEFPVAAVTNDHKPCGLKQPKFILPQPRRLKPVSLGQNQGVSSTAPPRRALEENLSLASSSFWCLQVPLACGCITPVSASVFTWPSPLCEVSLCLSLFFSFSFFFFLLAAPQGLRDLSSLTRD